MIIVLNLFSPSFSRQRVDIADAPELLVPIRIELDLPGASSILKDTFTWNLNGEKKKWDWIEYVGRRLRRSSIVLGGEKMLITCSILSYFKNDKSHQKSMRNSCVKT